MEIDSNKENHSDRRFNERFSLELPTTLHVTSGPHPEILEGIHTKDVCSGGAFINSESPLPPGTEVNVDLVLPLEKLKQLSGGTIRITVSGKIIRSEEKGMAIRFEDKYEIASTSLSRRIPPVDLTGREEEILYWIATGASNQDIAEELSIGLSTVKTHIYNLFKKIDVSNRLQAILWRARYY